MEVCITALLVNMGAGMHILCIDDSQYYNNGIWINSDFGVGKQKMDYRDLKNVYRLYVGWGEWMSKVVRALIEHRYSPKYISSIIRDRHNLDDILLLCAEMLQFRNNVTLHFPCWWCLICKVQSEMSSVSPCKGDIACRLQIVSLILIPKTKELTKWARVI